MNVQVCSLVYCISVLLTLDIEISSLLSRSERHWTSTSWHFIFVSDTSINIDNDIFFVCGTSINIANHMVDVDHNYDSSDNIGNQQLYYGP